MSELAPQSSKYKVSLGSAVFILLACLSFGVAGYFGYDTYKFLDDGAYINGEFVGMDARSVQKTDSDGHAYTEIEYYPVVAYKLTEAESYTVKGKFELSEYAYSEGQAVEVIYQPDHPRQARINSFREIWGVTGVFCLIGFVFAGFAALNIWLSK